MRLEGKQIIAADRATVWAALNDPEVLKACMPGCQSFDAVGENRFETVIKQKVGPVSATFKSQVDLLDVNPPNSYRIVGEGKGGAAGFAKGEADVSLADAPGGTELSYGVEVKMGGKIAQLGSRLIDGFARKLADQFFGAFKAQVEGPDAAPVEAAPPSPAAPETARAPQPVVEPVAAPATPGAASAEAGPQKLSWWKRLLKRLFG
ncbi:CoxG family protein [Rubrimonas sp.]|uniref:CoxG family protein n=1 Tax=Rubrimonas sp. TaxID=2036015 RepID=UPI002FDE05F9